MTFRTKTAARSYEQQQTSDVRRGTWIDPRLGQTSFRTFATEWQRTTVDLRPTTRARTDGILRVHLLPHFGDWPLSSILALDVRAFVAEQVGNGAAPATVGKHLRLLSQILAAAKASKYIGDNPCTGVKPPQLQEEEPVFLEAEQVNALADAIEPRFRAMVLVAGYRGLRWGELAGLRLSRVQLVPGTLEVAEILVEVAGAFSFGPPKTRQGRRTIPLPPFLVQVLRQHIKAYPGGEFVFTSPKGMLLHRSSFARRYFQPAVEAAGLDERLTFHGLRHTAVSLLAAEGAQIPELATIMGWSRSTAAAMAVRYAHLFPSRQEHLTVRLEAVYRRTQGDDADETDDVLMTSTPETEETPEV